MTPVVLPRVRLIFLLAGLVTMMGLAPGSTVAASDDPYAADPLGLIANYDQVSYYTTRPDTFEVSICNPEHLVPTLEEVVDYFNNESGLPEFWLSVSNGAYDLRFVAGVNGCYPRVEKQASGQHTAGFVIISPEMSSTALPASFGPISGRTWGGPGSNGRFAQNLYWVADHATLIWRAVTALTMGITFDWPPSFTAAVPEGT